MHILYLAIVDFHYEGGLVAFLEAHLARRGNKPTEDDAKAAEERPGMAAYEMPQDGDEEKTLNKEKVKA